MNCSRCNWKFSVAAAPWKRTRKLCRAAERTSLCGRFWQRFGFKLTAAQTRVLREIRTDMSGAVPMRRLAARRCRLGQNGRRRVQCADGAGKRFQRGVDGADGNSSGATFSKFHALADPLGVRVELQTGARKTVESRELRVESRAIAPALQPSTLNPQLFHRHARAHHFASFDIPNLGPRHHR